MQRPWCLFPRDEFCSLRDKAQDYSLNNAQDTEGFGRKVAPNSIANDHQVV